MSEENIKTVRNLVEALNRRDASGYLACCTEDVEVRTAAVAIEGAYVGAEGVRRSFADLDDAAPDFRLAVERVDTLGPDRILAFERGTASGRSSGVALEEGIPFWTVYDFADGKIKRIRVFGDQQQALEAAGLSE